MQLLATPQSSSVCWLTAAYLRLIWDVLADLVRDWDAHITAGLLALHISADVTTLALALAKQQTFAEASCRIRK